MNKPGNLVLLNTDGSSSDSTQGRNTQSATSSNWAQVTSATEENISDRIENEIKPICETSFDKSVAFSFSSGALFVIQHNGDPTDGSAAVQLELLKSNVNVRPILQDDRYNPSTAPDVSLLQCMRGDQSVDGSHPTSSPKGTDTFAGPSDADVEAHRRAEDRYFVCRMCGKSNRRRADFVVHYRTHTDKKPYACDMCEKECTTKGGLDKHRPIDNAEKLYKCPILGKAFTDAINRNTQYRNVHIAM
ncbi:hypothetical protein AVEN_176253-1 [Araneus ventricosus]|uniref:C2H2-type domain-containing protein n=1 Tax=Araneus ventricosus TaxID=182803 RepID=A0A4Y2TXY6_ARAVE|nr:hypothetical protein AVEN_176253-1 [Araneus ventricosus]